MTVLTLVRHGQTDWNRDRRIQGSTDIPLNDTGRVQARETAEIIAAELGAAVPQTYPQLRERSYGEAEGVDAREFFTRWGYPHLAEVPGAEPHDALRERALGALRLVAADLRRRTAPVAASLVVVSHGALIREVLRHATGGALPEVGERLPNGSSRRLLLERDRLRLLSYGAVPP